MTTPRITPLTHDELVRRTHPTAGDTCHHTISRMIRGRVESVDLDGLCHVVCANGARVADHSDHWQVIA